LSRFPIILGSIIFPEINCGTIRQPKRKNDIILLSKSVKLYKNGRVKAIIPQIAGIKSRRNTKSANTRAYSSQNTSIIIALIAPLNKANQNFETKNTLRS